MSTAATCRWLRYSCLTPSGHRPTPGSPLPMVSLRSSTRVLVSAGLAAACLSVGYGLGLRDSLGVSAPPRPPVSAADQRAFGVVWETLAELQRDYYQRDALDPDKLAAGAARGMVQA